MADNERLICQSDALSECGQGIRFDLPELGENVTGFVVRYEGKPYAYVNQCAHIPVELDWNAGEFFNITRSLLICATHGALYAPDSGWCIAGPCKGKRLKSLNISEQNGIITLQNTAAGKD